MSKRMKHVFAFEHAKIGFALLLALMIIVSYTPLAAYSSQSSNATYYVSATGDDSNPGTLDLPWRTIQKAADTLVGGNTVLVREGVYEEFVTIKSAGSELQGYITFQAYPGEHPVIDGANLDVGSGQSSLIHLRNANYVVVDGFEIRNLSSGSSSEYPAGIRVQSGGSNIHLLNNNVHHIANLSPDGNAHGIHIYGDALTPLSQIRVSGNRVHDLTLGWSESLTVSGNVDGFSVDHNTVYNNNNIGIDLAGFYGACSSPCQDQARNGVVVDNTVYNIDSSVNPAYGGGTNSAGGIYADGAANIVIERNHVYSSGFGIELASENEGRTTAHVTVRNNYIHHNDGAGIIMGGSESTNGGSANNVIRNNTLLLNDQLKQGYGEITLQENNFDNLIVNNVIYAQPQKTMIHKSNASGGGNIVDFNLYYRTDGMDENDWEWEEQSYASWEDYKKATNHDANSLFADPRLTDISGGLITLMEGSPAIDRGTGGDSSAADYYGAPRRQGLGIDIGAAEYGGPAATHAPTPSPEPTPGQTASASHPPGSSTPAPAAPVTGGFVVDGHFEDWAAVRDLASGSSNVTAMKAKLSGGELYVLVTGYLLGEKGQLYLNADGNEKTGFQAPFWNGAGADYLMEDGVLYSYSGSGGTDWGWTEVRNYKKSGKFVASSTVVEAAISLNDMAVTTGDAIRIGYVWKDSHEDKLPIANKLAGVNSGSAQVPGSMTTPTPTSPKVALDGKSSDWNEVEYFVEGISNPTGLKLTHDDNNLYVLVEGNKLTSKTQIYFSTDGSANTGYKASGWGASGAEYLIENGRMYSYAGKGTNWKWQSEINLKSSNRYVASQSLVEAAIPLSQLGLTKGDSFTVGVLLNDNKATQLPAEGNLLSYTLR
ncbi:right-handed parallel beta-helix repeat-containing protein [Paenibacillus sp. LHD-117]|uniref:choice-of-anchor Q domain-containing protein n=1 Tax=Paenibacillus sp. LHD-117 TaxID=3071412 RepID=UPI0027E070A0|nr:choice-of-anchor Q domain-containing protein [Paenibacillus sp. LHD-117]MDQ6420729.1 right-handed parallel beta-helix repeat-containing protein [Paenibacillus sp. LHD-117]